MFMMLAHMLGFCEIAEAKPDVGNDVVEFGMNSIVAYLMEWFMPGFIRENLDRHLGSNWAEAIVGPMYAPLLAGGATLFLIWLILRWMHQRKIYFKI